jgi:hypothetical protein
MGNDASEGKVLRSDTRAQPPSVPTASCIARDVPWGVRARVLRCQWPMEAGDAGSADTRPGVARLPFNPRRLPRCRQLGFRPRRFASPGESGVRRDLPIWTPPMVRDRRHPGSGSIGTRCWGLRQHAHWLRLSTTSTPPRHRERSVALLTAARTRSSPSDTRRALTSTSGTRTAAAACWTTAASALLRAGIRPSTEPSSPVSRNSARSSPEPAGEPHWNDGGVIFATDSRPVAGK